MTEVNTKNKYDSEMNLSPDTSTGMIAGKIKDGSRVLEFGCAYGRMTRYLAEGLHCRVYIVEIQPEAYECARQYAADGVCGDIGRYEWLERFDGVQFDAIVFADVLEHLLDPQGVLGKAATLLDPKGRIYISIPNVTHSDVLVKAVNGYIDYTKEGLLDETHIHFWGLNNLPVLAEQCGLSLSVVEGTYCPADHTEQRMEDRDQSRLLGNLLHERWESEVYQFILTMERQNPAVETEYRLAKPCIKSHVYRDTGNGFNEREFSVCESTLVEECVYSLYHILYQAEDVRQLRFDPVEGQGCIITRIAVYQDGRQLAPAAYSDCFRMDDDHLLLLGDDPWILYQTDGTGHPIQIEAEFILEGERYLSCMTQNAIKQYAENGEKNQRIQDLEEELNHQQQSYIQQQEEYQAQLDKMNAEYDDTCRQAKEEQEGLRKTIDEKEETITQIMDDLRRKEAQIAERDKALQHIEHQLSEKEEQLLVLKQEMQEEQQKTEQRISKLNEAQNYQQTRAYNFQMIANNKDCLLIEQENRIKQMESQLQWDQTLLNHFRSLWTVKIRMHLAAIYHGLRRRMGLETPKAEA